MLTPKQVAARLAVSPRTVYLWIEQGRLPAVRLSERVTRVSEEALARFEAAGVAAGANAVSPNGESLAAEERVAYGGARPAAAAVALCPRCGADVNLADTRSTTQRLRGLLAEHRDEILALAERSGVSNIRIFGSVARGDARPGSDIDFLVDLKEGKSLFDLSGFEFELADLLDWDIDVGSEEGMKPEMRARALREAVEL